MKQITFWRNLRRQHELLCSWQCHYWNRWDLYTKEMALLVIICIYLLFIFINELHSICNRTCYSFMGEVTFFSIEILLPQHDIRIPELHLTLNIKYVSLTYSIMNTFLSWNLTSANNTLYS